MRWSEFKQVLNVLFLINTGRGLDASHLDYLGKFLFSKYTDQLLIDSNKFFVACDDYSLTATFKNYFTFLAFF